MFEIVDKSRKLCVLSSIIFNLTATSGTCFKRTWPIRNEMKKAFLFQQVEYIFQVNLIIS